jgi:hypothetical protein
VNTVTWSTGEDTPALATIPDSTVIRERAITGRAV